jgi:hypothetical protein
VDAEVVAVSNIAVTAEVVAAAVAAGAPVDAEVVAVANMAVTAEVVAVVATACYRM